MSLNLSTKVISEKSNNIIKVSIIGTIKFNRVRILLTYAVLSQWYS